jgi:hypothetical protein
VPTAKGPISAAIMQIAAIPLANIGKIKVIKLNNNKKES